MPVSLPAVIKLKGYKLIRNDSFDEVLYSLVLEATAKSLSRAITKCVDRAKSLEDQLKERYGLIYYGFEVLTQVREKDIWRAVVKIDYVAEECIEGDEFHSYSERMDEDLGMGRIKVKDTTLVDYLLLLNIIDELEMVVMNPPALKDVLDMAANIGIKSAYLKLLELERRGLVSIKQGHVERM